MKDRTQVFVMGSITLLTAVLIISIFAGRLNMETKASEEPIQVEEVETAVRYVVPEKQDVAINWNEVTKATVTNTLKKFRVEVVKMDAESGKAQGDATLAGAVYGIYDGETLVDTYTTDADGKFTTTYYVCGNDWSIREITPSEGYLLDGSVHHVGAEPKNYKVEYNTTSNDVTEQVVKGKVSIIKHSDDGSTQIETPEEGAEFLVYLKSAGSYDNAKSSEKDHLVCDENGYAETKDLPYGTYTVHQTKGWEGRELISDFDVFVSKDGEVYRYLINNSLFESYIKVVKKDTETGKVIPLEGAGFQIYDESGKLVTMQYTYPEVTTLDTFYTGPNGYLITPEVLPYGNYTLVEVQAPHGYVLDSTPISFKVTGDNSTEESGVTVVTVEKSDMAQKGKIHIGKTGEVFATVTVSGEGVADKDGNLAEGKDMYTPVYEVKGRAGAVYDVIAADNIVTGDGTVRAEKGEVVDTITTDDDGNAVTKELYLGKYKVVEKTAPEGFVLNAEEHEVELVYAGQEVSVTEANTSFYNERQKVMIGLKKTMEVNEVFGNGTRGEVHNVAFGLFADEDIKAADGTMIPKDGLIEILFCDTEGMLTFTTDVPFGKYYVQEVKADQHYVISEEKYPVAFEYQGQDTALVNIHVNEGNAIENELIHGKITGLKVDTDGNALANAKIGLFNVDTEKFTEDNAILVSVSDENGVYSYQYKNASIKNYFWDGGSILEMYAFLKETYENDTNDCRVGVHIDWDGVIHNIPGKDVLNEIDIMSIKDNLPTFISCKIGNVDQMALYELETVANRFGGKYAKKVLIIAKDMALGHLLRAEEMGIEVKKMDTAITEPFVFE